MSGNLDGAISAHVAENFHGFYTEGWVVVAVSTALDDPNRKNYRIMTPDNQPFHVDVGLLDIGRMIIKDQWCEGAEDDEND